jgi:SAM-dependent methyltransferase
MLRSLFSSLRGQPKSSEFADLPADLRAFISQFGGDVSLSIGPRSMVAPSPTQAAFIGRSPEEGRDFINVLGGVLPRGSQHPFKIVSFFTEDNEYAEHAERLKASLEALNLPHEIVAFRSDPAWELTCAKKARFVRDQWHASDVPIVWLDADATVEQYPTLFGAIDADFAVHKWNGWQLGSGTVYFGRSNLARDLIDQWVIRSTADPATWDQVHLESAWCDISAKAPLRTVWLPRSYLQIFDASTQGLESVIKHWQASRKPKAEGRTTGRGMPNITGAGVRDRHNNHLWRSAEEAFWINEGTAHIKPEIGYEFPEGFDVSIPLRHAIGDRFPVLEIGCGVGRIASLFSPQEYLGVDINPTAISAARAALPQHDLRIWDTGHRYPEAPTAFFYTVLLHVSDQILPDLLREASQGRERFIIAEVMDSRWRRDGDPPVFNRNPEEYILAMQDIGFRLVSAGKRPYARYDCEPFNIGRDSRLTILAFDRPPA